MSEEQANGSGKADIKEVETVLGEPNRFPDTVGNGLYDPVSRVGDDTHVQRHGGTNKNEVIYYHFWAIYAEWLK